MRKAFSASALQKFSFYRLRVLLWTMTMMRLRDLIAQRAMLLPRFRRKITTCSVSAVNRAKRVDVRLSRRRGLLQKSHRSGYNVQNVRTPVVLAVLAFSPRRIQRNRGCVLRTSAQCAAISAVTQRRPPYDASSAGSRIATRALQAPNSKKRTRMSGWKSTALYYRRIRST